MNPRKRPASMDAGLPAYASFFEVADPTMEATHEEPSLALPKAFIKRFHSYLSHSLILEAPNGQTWKAHLEANIQKQMRITAGWQDLADYMNVQSGDLLIFDLVSKGHFRVHIYEGEDMCEKDIYTKKLQSLERDTHTPRAQETVEHAKKRRKEMMQTCNTYAGSDHANSKYSMLVQKREAVHTQMIPAGLNNDKCTKSMELPNAQKKEAVHSCKRHSSPNNGNCIKSREEIMHISKGHVRFDSSNGSESVENMQTSNAHTTVKHGTGIPSLENADIQKKEINHTCKAHGAHGNGLCNTHPYTPSQVWSGKKRFNLAAKMHLTLKDFHQLCLHFHEETQEAFKKVIAFTSNNPFTCIVMLHSNVCHGFKVAIPRPFAEQTLSAEPEHVAFIDADNRAWSVTWLGYNNPNPAFSAGWKHFATDHRLQCGDICIFEHANIKALTSFKVHIFKVNTEDASAIQRSIPANLSNLIARGSS